MMLGAYIAQSLENFRLALVFKPNKSTACQSPLRGQDEVTVMPVDALGCRASCNYAKLSSIKI